MTSKLRLITGLFASEMLLESGMSALHFNPLFDPTTLKAGFGDFTVVLALSQEDKAQVSQWLEAEHFIGSFRPVGHGFCHIILEDGQPVAVVQWAACAFRLKDREAYIGWSALQCAKRRNLIVNNVRFLVLNASRRPNLASRALAHSVKALAAHWQEQFGYQPLMVETFTDIELHEGTCYKAAGWTPLGLTDGNSRQRAEFYVRNDRPKKLWIKELQPDARARLCAATLAPEQAAGETSGKGAPLPVKVSELVPLLTVLRSVKDPRGRNRHYHIGLLLTLIALGLLCGGTNLNEVLRHLHRLSQVQMHLLGVRPRKGKNKLEPPSYECFRQLLLALDLDAFALTLSQWLGAHRGALPAALALDGKRIRGTLGTIVTLCDTAQKVPVAVAATMQLGGEQACARDLLRRDQTVLLNCTVSLDALYANEENALIIVQEKGGDYFISLKFNQPTVRTYVEGQLLGSVANSTTANSSVSSAEGFAAGASPNVTHSSSASVGLMKLKILPLQEGETKAKSILVPNITKENSHLFKKRLSAVTARSSSERRQHAH
jgi:Domain of unknown function (DUF4338)/DDE_Tnp_1-associated